MKHKKLVRYPMSFIFVMCFFILLFILLVLGLSGVKEETLRNLDNRKYKYPYEQKCTVVELHEKTGLDLFKSNQKCYISAEGFSLFMDNLDSQMSIEGFYLSKPDKLLFPFVEGGISDTNSDPVVVLGIKYKQNTKLENGTRFFTISGEKYRVLGFVGSKYSEILDYKIILFADRLGNNAKKDVEEQLAGGFDITLQGEQNNMDLVYGAYEKEMQQKGIVLQRGSCMRSVSANNSYLVLALIIIAFCLINGVLVANVWIWQRKNEIHVLFLFGMNWSQIFFRLYKSFLASAFLGSTLALLTIRLFIQQASANYLYYNIWDIGLVVIVTPLAGAVVLLLNMIKIRKENNEIYFE